MLVPAFTPFSFHWKKGVDPPFTGVAVKITLDPAQTGFADGAIVILIGKSGLTIIVTVLEVAGFPLAHAAFEVSTQETISPFTGL